MLKTKHRERPTPTPRVDCDFDACDQKAIARVPGVVGLANVCAKHYAFLAQREAELFCDSQALQSVADKLAYCRTMMKQFGNGNFESWSRSVTQQTVAILIQSGNHKLLDKLRGAGVIDGYNRLVKT